MLDEKEIEENKNKFISLLESISREGSDIKGLINKLCGSDFFVAPASTVYHSAYRGGLCKHSLNVYENLKLLNEVKGLGFSEDSIIITSLLHDISKMNYYEMAERNVKDEDGHWIKVPYIKTRDAKDRFIYAGHGANSEYMVGRFIPLQLSESVAIINHMGGKDIYSGAVSDANISEIYNRYPLALFLHLSDMMSTFYSESC